MLKPVIEYSEQLLILARNRQWGQFQKQLVRRESLIAELTAVIDFNNPPYALSEQIQTLLQLNKQLCELAEAEQQELSGALALLNKGDKAKSAYKEMK